MNNITKIGNGLLLVDYSNIVHKAMWVNQRLTYKGTFTGGLYGFIKQLISTLERYINIDNIVVCKDSSPYIRKKLLPTYKGDRKGYDEESLMKLQQSKSLVDEFLNICNIQIAEFKGHEADDIIAQYCKNYYLKFYNLIIKSNDNDLFQLLKKNIIIERNKGKFINLQQFEDEYNISPQQWIDVIALKGSHNAVSGIFGVGIKTALKIVKNQDLFDKYYADNKDMIDLNRKLIGLPYQKLNINLVKPQSYNKKQLRLFLASYGIRINVNDIYDNLRKIYSE